VGEPGLWLSKLQQAAGNARATGKRKSTRHRADTDTDETFETEVTRRDNPWRAYLTIIEGCDKRARTAWCRSRAVPNAAALAIPY